MLEWSFNATLPQENTFGMVDTNYKSQNQFLYAPEIVS